jgi:integrase
MATFDKRGPYQWRARIRRKGYPLQVKTFETYEDAAQWARMIENEMDRGMFVSRKEAESTTLDEALERYRNEITPDKKGAKQERSRINILKRSNLAPRYLASIRGTDVAKYRDERLKNRSPITVSNELILLSHLFTVARKEWGMEGLTNPVSNIRKPKQPPGRDRRLMPGEEDLLLSTSSAQMQSLIILALETAMRQGELTSILWENVSMARRTIRILDTKNSEARTIPLSTRAVSALKKVPRTLNTPLVFPIKNPSRKFSDTCKKAEIGDLRFHDLRHEATSRLFEKGLNPMEVASITGHKTLQMLKRYTHLRAEELAAKLG